MNSLKSRPTFTIPATARQIWKQIDAWLRRRALPAARALWEKFTRWSRERSHAQAFVFWLAARALIALGQDTHAESLLRALPLDRATPETHWLHATLLQRRQASPEQQRHAWERLLEHEPGRKYAGAAWLALGDLLADIPWEDGAAAIAAYQHAEAAGVEVPHLAAYRMGDWDALPCLRHHPDYAYPVVVTIDLEVDPAPNTVPGSRVFEVGAIRTKGRSVLDSYVRYIARDFRPRKALRLDEWQNAQPEEQVVSDLRAFIGEALVAGHNLRDFDAVHLTGMNVPIPTERIVDTLDIARMLYPESLYHNLGLLCRTHGIPLDADERHTALADAHACAALVHELGDELAQRGGALVTGVRALVTPDSAFDRALLQPRDIPADPALPWTLDPTPMPPHLLFLPDAASASPAMTDALRGAGDLLIELDDPAGAYVREVPATTRALVTVATRDRVERMLAACSDGQAVYALPEPTALLCPDAMRALIDSEKDSEQRLRLFCAYQASHNHDASVLYPMRLPSHATDHTPEQLRQALKQAYCPEDADHRATCGGMQAMRAAIAACPLLLATHAALFHQPNSPAADVIVMDDIGDLASTLPEYVAGAITSEQVRDALGSATRGLAERLDAHISTCVRDLLPRPAFHERIALSILDPYLTQPESGEASNILATLDAVGGEGAEMAQRIRALLQDAAKEPVSPEDTHAFWLDVWFADDQSGQVIQRWAMRGLSANLAEVFKTRCWQPYQRHIVCGPALLPDPMGSAFLERSLGVPSGLRRQQDKRERRTQVWLPSPEALAPSGILGQRQWAMGAGALLYERAKSSDRTLAVTLTPIPIADAMAAASQQVTAALGRQTLARTLGWGTTQVAERLEAGARKVMAFMSPRARRKTLDQSVAVEVSGPLRFLNTHDPLVAARMRVFASRYPSEGPFNAYLLPQALLELLGRLSSRADTHLILDSRLMTKRYRDEALHALGNSADVRCIEQAPARSPDGDAFLETLGRELDARGLTLHQDVTDEDLRLVLRSLWGVGEFRSYERTTAVDAVERVTQKEVIRGTLDGKDQLLVVPTGGGKSLCFQLPAVLYADVFPPRVTLVFSPLIALMADQVEALNRRGVFSAVLINSTLGPAQRQERLRGIRRGDYSIIYVAPEQIHSQGLRRALEGREVALVAIDEAHCLSQWGHDFRTDYFAVKRWLNERVSHNQERSFPILALTATARQAYEDPNDPELSDKASTVKDIIEKLGLDKQKTDIYTASTTRDELEFRVERIEPQPLQCFACHSPMAAQAGEAKCPNCGKRRYVPDSEIREAVEAAKRERLIALLAEAGLGGLWQRLRPEDGSPQERGLVYCAFRKTTEALAEVLTKRFPDLRVRAYHAGLDAADREAVLDAFSHEGEKRLDIVVATNAFGMGIDVERLGFVVHFDSPGTLEAYYQEAGRAGRNRGAEKAFDKRHRAQCILLYHPLDLQKQRSLSRQNVVTDQQIRDIYAALSEMAQIAHERPDKAEEHASAGNNYPEQFDARELMVTQRNLAARAIVDEDAIGTCLYYLEYQTAAHDQPVLARGENTNRTWRLKWEQDYEEQIVLLPPDSPSRPLLDAFRNVEEYQLSEVSYTAISVVDLAESLGWKYGRLESELLNLARRHIIVYACDGRLRWTEDAQQACDSLARLQKDVNRFLNEAERSSGGRLSAGDTVYVNLAKTSETFDGGVDLARFAHFLFALSQEDAEPQRLFERFARALRKPQPFMYECRLWQERGDRRVGDIVKQVFRDLERAIDQLKQLGITAEWQAFDILQAEPNYRRRQELHRWLLLLDMLNLLRYQGDASMGIALTVTLLQPQIMEEELAIDLESLRLKETYTKHKLKQIEAYAALKSPDERTQLFDRYFFGAHALIERIDPHLRAGLTQAQVDIAHFAGDYHLVEGAAGCGKTTVLVEHIKRLVYQQQVPLDRIMITTHFNSAITRIDNQLEVLKEDGAAALTHTIQSFGNRLFIRHRALLRRPDGKPYYSRDPKLVHDAKSERETQLQLISSALKELHNGHWPREWWPEGLRAPQVAGMYRPDARAEARLLDTFKSLRQRGVFPASSTKREDILKALGSEDEGRYSAPERYAIYMRLLQFMGEKGLYTYDDQVLFALAILRANPEVKKEYRRYYEHVIIDEFQDFTPAAALLLLEICGLQRNVLMFGDRDQDIRSKTMSAGELFQEFGRRDACGAPHELRINFRSTQEILDLATAVRDWQEPDAMKRGHLIANRGSSGEKPVCLRVSVQVPPDAHIEPGMDPTPDSATRLLSAMVDAALEQISQLDDDDSGRVALITAETTWLGHLETLLIERNISYSVLKHEFTYQAEHVLNVLAYLRLIADSRLDEEAVRLIRKCVVPYLNSAQIKSLRGMAAQAGVSLMSVLRDTKALRQAKVSPEQAKFLEMHLAIIANFSPETRLADIEKAIHDIPDNPIDALAEDGDKLHDVQTLLKTMEHKTVVEALQEVDRHVAYLDEHRGNTSLCLTTVDHAKSEEFDTVFFLGAQILPTRGFDTRRDKRRLYVTISRARNRLFLLYDDAAGLHPILRGVASNLYTHASWPLERREDNAKEPDGDELPF